VSDTRNHKDSELSHIYKEGGWPEPSRQIDAAILAAARAQHSFLRRWSPPLALAATIVLSFTLLLRMSEEKPDDALYSLPIPDRQPAAEESKPAIAPEPAPAPKPALVPLLAPSAKSAAPLRPASAPRPAAAPPSAPAPATAASAFALKKETPEAARADRLEREPQPDQSPRALESVPPRELPQEVRPESAPAARRLPEPAASISGNVRSGATANLITPSLTRSPQTWIEEIRRLKTQGKTEEAERELAEFKKRNPDYELPGDLRQRQGASPPP